MEPLHESFKLTTRRLRFKHPLNNYIEDVSLLAWLWVLLFGFMYFAVKGVWRHVLLSIIFALLTAGISWLIYPFFVRAIMKKHYLRQGWTEVTE